MTVQVAGHVLCRCPACRDVGGPSGVDGSEVIRLTRRCPEGPMTKSGREIMEIFEAFDLTGTAWSAAQLTGCDAKTVARYVAVRDAGGDPLARAARPRLIDGFMPKIEEVVDRSKGKIRADIAHRKLTAMGYRGRGGEAGLAGRPAPALPALDPGAGHVAAVGLGDGPRIGGRKTQLLSARPAWSRFRVVILAW